MSEDLYQHFFGKTPPFHPTPEAWGKLTLETLDLINKKINSAFYLVPEEAFTIIHLSAFFIEPNEWAARFKRYRSSALKFFRTPEGVWLTIAQGLYISEIEDACKKLIPNFDPAKYNDRTITRSPRHEIAPGVTSTPTTITKPKKAIPRVIKPRVPTVTEFILRHSPSHSYEQVYLTTLACCKNKKSATGRKVYPYGQRYIAKLTRLNLRTVKRAWSFLRHQGIFNKARNENPKEHHCALWYVCTSMIQVSYFRDAENRHRRSKRQY